MNSDRCNCGVFNTRQRARLCAAAIVGLSILASRVDVHAGVLVQMDYGSLGTVNVDLLDSVAPASVAIFLQYVNAGEYSNTIIHRAQDLVPNGIGIVQGGGYNSNFVHIPTFAPIVREYHLGNSRGTLAMARTPLPDSATSEWYFNTSDNSVTLGPGNGGGYAVFGQVVGAALGTINNIDALPFYSTHGFPSVPLQTYTQADQLAGVDVTSHLVVLNGVSVVKNHASFQNPILPGDVNNDGVVSPIDQLLVTNYLSAHGAHTLTADDVGNTFLYYDINGDGQVSQLDLVPEPTALCIAAPALLALAWFRRRATKYSKTLTLTV